VNERDKELITEFKKRLSSELGNHLRRIIVFGSRARGDEADESDLDIVALVDEKSKDIERRLEDIVYQVMWDYDFKPIISLKVFSESQFNNALSKGFSFYRHVQQEGVAV
jgi:predicted nucleotidyltransferase